MYIYLVISGIVFNILLLWIIAMSSIDRIFTKKMNKKEAAEKAKKKALYKEELKLVEPVWQVWAKRLDDFQQNYDKENDCTKQLLIGKEMDAHKFCGKYYFTSIGTSLPLYELGKENGWVRKK